MKENPLLKLESFGQSVWLDFIRRGMIPSGELQQLIKEDGLSGVTSNPSIFEKAIAGSHDYDGAIRALALEGKNADEIYLALAVEDIRQVADLFRPIYDQSGGRTGFVSLEVSPRLAYDTAGTVAEACRLWGLVERPNLFIKVPATREGLPAIQELIGEGININVTLLFGLPRYREVADAYLAGIEARASAGMPLERVASVASFFLSRIDVAIDPLLEKIANTGGSKTKMAVGLEGEVAIASAKGAYQIYKEVFAGERFHRLAAKGARSQQLLWASTSTKNALYSDVKYVEPLIGPDSVNTMPLETINAYRDHGRPASSLDKGAAGARRVLERLPEVGVDLEKITQQLEDEGVQKFAGAFNVLMSTLEQKRRAALKEPVDRQILHAGDYEAAVQERLTNLEHIGFCSRLWRKDPSLWKTDPQSQTVIRDSLGWLHVAEKLEEHLNLLAQFTADVLTGGFRHVVHMGMGGSSLAPLVFQRTFAPAANALALTVIDTTDPKTLLNIEKQIPLAETLFIVATKSGTTAEPLAFGDYFYAQVKRLKGTRAGESFVAITDPGTPLEKLAKKRRFRKTFLNFSDIGGRYSALSYFGLVPAALMGIDVSELLVRALRMAHACASCVPVQENPGLFLGAVMGELARRGRDKVTLLVSEPVAALGMWLEQLLAESTGKEGTGILPIAGELPGDPSDYGDDRLFVSIRLKEDADAELELAVRRLLEAKQPLIEIHLDDRLDLGQEFFRWEVATATAGAVLGINAFDQPNVQESKDNTNRLLAALEKKGELPEPGPGLVEAPLRLYAEDVGSSLSDSLARFLRKAAQRSYVALMAYLTEEPATEQPLQAIRREIRDKLRVATTFGYGPRLLHSTGQFHKGGPNTGLFLQLTADDAVDANIPGQRYGFSLLKRAQALGDLEALRKHGRPAIRIHLGPDTDLGLVALRQAIEAALAQI